MTGVKDGSLLHESFRLTIALKGLHALLEIILGILILKINPQALNRFLLNFLHPELSRGHADFITSHLLRASQHFAAGGKRFASLYLLSHGSVKLVLIVALFRNKLWAYPATIATLSAFVGYQMYRFALTHSLAMIFLTVFDLVVIFLTWMEYQKQSSDVAANRAPI